MATKKSRDYSKPFTPPTVRVSLIEKGSGLARAEKALTAQNSEADREKWAEVKKYKDGLALTLTDASIALVKFGDFERENAADLKLLRSLSFDGAKGIVDEAVRVSAQNRCDGLFRILQATKETLATAEKRVDALGPRDLLGPRMHSDAPGIRSYGEMAPAAVEKIRFDIDRAIRTVGHLPKIIAEAQGAVENVASALERAKHVRAKEASLPGAVPISGTIRDPQEIERAQAANPNIPVQTSYETFPAYESDRK